MKEAEPLWERLRHDGDEMTADELAAAERMADQAEKILADARAADDDPPPHPTLRIVR